jgi:hypothetical protein
MKMTSSSLRYSQYYPDSSTGTYFYNNISYCTVWAFLWAFGKLRSPVIYQSSEHFVQSRSLAYLSTLRPVLYSRVYWELAVELFLRKGSYIFIWGAKDAQNISLHIPYVVQKNCMHGSKLLSNVTVRVGSSAVAMIYSSNDPPPTMHRNECHFFSLNIPHPSSKLKIALIVS